VDLPAGLAEIGDNAFCDSGLQSIHIPAGVTTISNTAFRQCGDIARITVDSGNSRFSAEDDALYSGTSLVLCAPQHVGTLTLRKGVKTILTGAFYQSRVERLILPEGLETIQDGAFEGASSLRRVDLPKSLKAAGLKAFRLAQKDSGGKSYGFTVYAEYGTYAHSYCRSQYAKLNNYGYIPSYICTRAIGKKGDNGSLKLNPGEKLLLQPEYFDDMDLKVLSYSTSDKKVATVSSSGLVTAKKKGTAVITILGEDGVKATLKVKVGDIFTPTRIKLNKSGTVKLRTGRKLTLTATIKPASAVTTVKWSNSKKQFATLEATGNTATITGVKPGTTTITVSTSNGRKAKLNVKVYTPETKTLDLNPADMTLFLGQGYQLRPVIDEGSTTTFTYTIKDKNVAKVSSKGKITALKVGTTKIVVKTKKGLKKTGTITVVPETSTTHYKNGTSGISVYALYEEPCYHMKEDCIELTYVPSKVPLEMALNYDKDPCPVCAATAALQVYYHKDGTYYHYDRTCSGVIEETRTLGEARAAGFSPCPKCVLFANHSQAVPQE